MAPKLGSSGTQTGFANGLIHFLKVPPLEGQEAAHLAPLPAHLALTEGTQNLLLWLCEPAILPAGQREAAHCCVQSVFLPEAL